MLIFNVTIALSHPNQRLNPFNDCESPLKFYNMRNVNYSMLVNSKHSEYGPYLHIKMISHDFRLIFLE